MDQSATWDISKLVATGSYKNFFRICLIKGKIKLIGKYI